MNKIKETYLGTNNRWRLPWVGVELESLYKESSAMRDLKVWKQNGVQILSIEKTQVLTMHE